MTDCIWLLLLRFPCTGPTFSSPNAISSSSCFASGTILWAEVQLGGRWGTWEHGHHGFSWANLQKGDVTVLRSMVKCSLRNQSLSGVSFQEFSLSAVLNARNMELWQHMGNAAYQGSSWKIQCPSFPGGCSCRYSLPKIFPNIGTLSNVLGINHIVSTNCWGTESPSYQLGNGGNPSEIQIPRCQPTLQSGLSMDSSLRPAMLIPFFQTPQLQICVWGVPPLQILRDVGAVAPIISPFNSPLWLLQI